MSKDLSILKQEAVSLLKQLISIPSFSKQEEKTAALLAKFFADKMIETQWVGNNIIVKNRYFNGEKPTILLNSHHDTVKPNSKYTKDPFEPLVEEGKLFGLGSNDAGGSLVSLIAVFLFYYEKENMNYNLVMACTAEEEISGTGGIEYVLPYLPPVDFAIVGEPTQMQMAVAERGLLVIDCLTHGKAGHAARKEGENAIIKAIKDIEWISSFHFPRVSQLLGSNQMTVTVIETDNKAHNVVPAHCRFVIDTRVNELYSFDEVIKTIKSNISSDVIPRSMRLKSTSIPLDHPVVSAGIELGLSYYGSPTTSDKALMPFPALKIGPGDSARSHSADEYIYVEEIENGIETYIQLLNRLL